MCWLMGLIQYHTYIHCVVEGLKWKLPIKWMLWWSALYKLSNALVMVMGISIMSMAKSSQEEKQANPSICRNWLLSMGFKGLRAVGCSRNYIFGHDSSSNALLYEIVYAPMISGCIRNQDAPSHRSHTVPLLLNEIINVIFLVEEIQKSVN